MKLYTKETLIEELLKIKARGWIAGSRPDNAGSIGNTLEDLLGIQENNLPIPNAAEWELKAHRVDSNSLVTLFHMEPSPRALRFVPAVLLPQYGWSHQKAGERYAFTEMSFRQTITGATHSDRGFKVSIDRSENKVLISFNPDAVNSRHDLWLADVAGRVGLHELDPQPYWGFEDLRNKAGTKLLNSFFVRAERKLEAGKEYFRYSSIMILQGFKFAGLLDGLENGHVFVDIDARTGHNHGTKFRIKPAKLPLLYAHQQIIA
ncbi:MAG: MvaI/BcnI family restriction endonuclease [Anaerolineae bacterium]